MRRRKEAPAGRDSSIESAAQFNYEFARSIVAHFTDQPTGGADNPFGPKTLQAIQSGSLQKIQHFARIEIPAAVGTLAEAHA